MLQLTGLEELKPVDILSRLVSILHLRILIILVIPVKIKQLNQSELKVSILVSSVINVETVNVLFMRF